MTNNLLLTIILAAVLMGMVVVGLAIGFLITGKSRLRRGCGLTPSKKKGEKPSCPMCGEKKSCEAIPKQPEESDLGRRESSRD